MAVADVARSRVAWGMEGAKKSIDKGASVLAIANMNISVKPLFREVATVFMYLSLHLLQKACLCTRPEASPVIRFLM